MASRNLPTESVSGASYYRFTAITYWDCVRRLEASFSAEGKQVFGNRMAVPIYFLISHAAELLLKCALLKRGVPMSALKRPDVRHSLTGLLRLLTEIIPISQETVSLIESINGQHQDHTLRYNFLMEGTRINTPPPSGAFKALEELLMAGRISTYGR